VRCSRPGDCFRDYFSGQRLNLCILERSYQAATYQLWAGHVLSARFAATCMHSCTWLLFCLRSPLAPCSSSLTANGADPSGIPNKRPEHMRELPLSQWRNSMMSSWEPCVYNSCAPLSAAPSKFSSALHPVSLATCNAVHKCAIRFQEVSAITVTVTVDVILTTRTRHLFISQVSDLF